MFQYVMKISKKYPPIRWILLTGYISLTLSVPNTSYAQVALPAPGIVVE